MITIRLISILGAIQNKRFNEYFDFIFAYVLAILAESKSNVYLKKSDGLC